MLKPALIIVIGLLIRWGKIFRKISLYLSNDLMIRRLYYCIPPQTHVWWEQSFRFSSRPKLSQFSPPLNSKVLEVGETACSTLGKPVPTNTIYHANKGTRNTSFSHWKENKRYGSSFLERQSEAITSLVCYEVVMEMSCSVVTMNMKRGSYRHVVCWLMLPCEQFVVCESTKRNNEEMYE